MTDTKTIEEELWELCCLRETDLARNLLDSSDRIDVLYRNGALFDATIQRSPEVFAHLLRYFEIHTPSSNYAERFTMLREILLDITGHHFYSHETRELLKPYLAGDSTQILCVIKDPRAKIPTRATPRDIGLDLVAIDIAKTLPNGVVLFDTGLAVSPPDGYYLEILPRSSISKTGWMLANSVGTIDPEYTGNLMIALVRVVPSAPDLVPPFCCCQLVLRKAEYAGVRVVDSLASTVRGDGGFGSTGNRVDVGYKDVAEKPEQDLLPTEWLARERANDSGVRYIGCQAGAKKPQPEHEPQFQNPYTNAWLQELDSRYGGGRWISKA
jgi:dUTP pyrophosphatase